MPVRLPSGAIAPLEVPSLSSLMAAGGDVAGIAAVAFAHDDVWPGDLLDDDTLFIATWALRAFSATSEALDLAAACAAWSRAPSEALGISDRQLAWQVDNALFTRLVSARSGEPQPEPEADGSEERVRFTTPEGTA